MTLRVRIIDQPYLALGIAVHFLARRDPFSGFRFSELVHTVDGQVRRKHALFAFDGDRVVGYLGWALCTEAQAQEFARTGRAPVSFNGDEGEIVWLLTTAAITPSALKAMIAVGKSLNVGRRVMGVRHKGHGRPVVFSQTILPRKQP